MNVLMLAEDFYPKTSGGAFIDWQAAVALAERGNRVVVVTPRTEGTAELERENGVEIHRPYRASSEAENPNSFSGQLLRVKFLFLVLPYLLRLTGNTDFEVIYSTNHLFHSIAKVLGVVRGVPVVNFIAYSPSITGDRARYDPVYVLEQLNFELFLGDLVLSRTPQIRDRIEERSTVSTKLIGGVVNEDEIRTAIDSDRSETDTDVITEWDGTTVLFVGRLVDIKNPVRTVEMLDELPSSYQLVVVGDGPVHDAIEEAIERLGVTNRVRLLGSCSHQRTLRLIHAADGVILPSDAEAYPTVVFEALSVRTTVVATPVGILPEITHSRLFVRPQDRMAETIESNVNESASGIDSDTLDRFSVGRFTDDVQTAVESVKK
ncbi:MULTISPECIES: glycosyltransferase family 4 protein [unclassified Haladaptatus]|uniref:glycosyltransferase family 4 protein n=1 Tax=unclassified Haladaptatus TaxID=2622732 RepID=UPI00209C4EB0|nr:MULTISPECIES: glycosyltransferase family 4 protein [unclassified Haladaptatus]MCO8244766.1 glycosyltransferase family 4 protein [Haladaptatus sp. AB643]MCO8255722.1 glycosyltransferase family 4 protein [Haladaptatus sp. AB618]